MSVSIEVLSEFVHRSLDGNDPNPTESLHFRSSWRGFGIGSVFLLQLNAGSVLATLVTCEERKGGNSRWSLPTHIVESPVELNWVTGMFIPAEAPVQWGPTDHVELSSGRGTMTLAGAICSPLVAFVGIDGTKDTFVPHPGTGGVLLAAHGESAWCTVAMRPEALTLPSKPLRFHLD